MKIIVNTKNILKKFNTKINEVEKFFVENRGAHLDYECVIKDLRYYRNVIQNHTKNEIELEAYIVDKLNFQFPKDYKYVKYEKSTMEELCDLFIAY
jgi:hypothetical protein